MDELQIIRISKAIADPTRYNILKVIASQEEICCGELAARFPIKQATVSHHLKVLGDAGLILIRQQGAHHFYRFAPDAMRVFSETLSMQFKKESS